MHSSSSSSSSSSTSDILQQYTEHAFAEESTSLTKPFNIEMYNAMEYSHPEIFKLLGTQFETLFHDIQNKRQHTIEVISKEIAQHDVSLLSPQEIRSYITEKVYIRNYMFCVEIEIVYTSLSTGNTVKVTEIDLDKINTFIKSAYYSKDKTPSMVIFIDEVFCCAILTKNGSINVVGGYSIPEIKFTLIHILQTVVDAHSHLPDVSNVKVNIKSINLYNMTISTSLPFCAIDIYNATSYLSSKRISYDLVAERFYILKIKPLKTYASSIHIRVFPTGGIVGYGFKSYDEINIAFGVVISMIKDFIRKTSYTILELQAKREEIIESWKNQELTKLNDRGKKISEWESKKNKHTQESSSLDIIHKEGEEEEGEEEEI